MIEIDHEHPTYKRNAFMWRKYRDLYAGGQEFKSRAGEYLLRRQKEPIDVYGERLHRVFYQNYVGSIIDWYASTLFRRAPSLYFDGGLESSRTFFAQFVDDCDRRGTNLSNFFRNCFIDTLISGASHVLIDFPRTNDAPHNRAEEDIAGISRAFLVRYEAEDLINWSHDEHGDYEWIVLRQQIRRQPNVGSTDSVLDTYWYYFDRQNYRTYKQSTSQGQSSGPIELIAKGRHGLANQARVPLITLEVTQGMWLMNKAADLQLEHFNKSNALGWAITMGLFAMPVIYSEREWNQIVGESYYIQLGPQDRFGWTEPDGKVYQIAAENLESLKEEIYRVCYLPQASGELVGGQAQSAAAKQLDFSITKEVLRAYGSTVKETLSRVMNAISDARLDHVRVSVSGLDELDITDFGTELDEATRLLGLGIPSPTLTRQIFHKLASKYLNDVRQEVKDQILHEIEQKY